MHAFVSIHCHLGKRTGLEALRVTHRRRMQEVGEHVGAEQLWAQLGPELGEVRGRCGPEMSKLFFFFWYRFRLLDSSLHLTVLF